MEEDKTKCQARVRVRGLNWPTYNQCSNKAKRDGYCNVHHPEAVERRKQKSDELHRKKWNVEILQLRGPYFYRVLKRIADGEDNPVEIAKEAIKDV